MAQIKVKIEKYFTGGLLQGMTIDEEMTFVNFDTAVRWAKSVTDSNFTNYDIKSVTNIKTNQKVEKF